MFSGFVVSALLLGACIAPNANAGDSDEVCYSGVISKVGDNGQISGTSCTDVIVADSKTTAIDGAGGNDVIIGGPNVVLVTGGDGWDYLVGNSVGAIMVGGSGDDIIDAGAPPLPDEKSPSVDRQIELAASLLPDPEASEFRNAVNEQLKIAHEMSMETGHEADWDLRQRAIDTNPLIQDVIGTREVDIGGIDNKMKAKIAQLQKEADADAQKTSAIAGKIVQESGNQASLMAAKDPIWGREDYDDILIGGRGSDEIHGRSGDDLLYGGIDDDKLYGEANDDYMLGGMGADRIDGASGDDIAQGDATGDKMSDSGSSTNDILSFASGGTDGFPSMDMSAFPNFPGMNSPERGIYVNLGAGIASNGSLITGGGNDPAAASPDDGTVFANFEHVVGTPFADYIVGDTRGNVLEGGGGSDVINGGGGTVTDFLLGDAGGDNLQAPAGSWLLGSAGDDYCGGSTVVAECESKPSNWVGVRDTTSISVGMTTQSWAGNVKSQLYVAGSTTDSFTRNGEDSVEVIQVDDGSGPPTYYFATAASSLKGQFSVAPADQTPGCSYSATVVICSPSTNVTTFVLSGFGSNDYLDANNVFRMTNTVVLGGQGYDTLKGGYIADDFMVDGTDVGADTLQGNAGDDGLVNTDGADSLWGADGDDLIVSSAVCQGDTLGGGPGTDSSSWAQYDTGSDPGTNYGVFANISTSNIGKNVGGALNCGSSPTNSFDGFEDLEGSRHSDILRGDSGSNQLIGRATGDQLWSYQGADRILANSADNDNIDCGSETDHAVIDDTSNGSDIYTNCDGNVVPGDPIFVDG